MINLKTIQKLWDESDTPMPSKWNELFQVSEQLLKERDAYRYALADHMNGFTREDELRNADKEASVMQRIIEQRNQYKQSKNGGEK